ncbi:MAG: choice-of-anchor tandem repeat GloVer-containing protein [Capsulimonadaceae bacterium]
MHTHPTLSSQVWPGRTTLRRAFHIWVGLRALFTSAIAAAIICSVIAVGAAAGPAVSATSCGARASATRLGPTAASTEVRLTLVLPLRNPDQLHTLLHKLYDPADPLYHHYLTPREFTEQFGPARDRVATVEAAAQASGFRVLDVTPNNSIIHVQAPASTVNSVFHVTLSDFVGPDGASYLSAGAAPTLPAAFAENGVSVIGLDGSHRLHHALDVNGGSAPVAESRDSSPNTLKYYSGTGLLPSDVYSIYDWSRVSTGAGQNVALFELDGWTQNDISVWETTALMGASSLTPEVVSVDGGTQVPITFDVSIETTLDIDMVLLMAPGISNLFVYVSDYWGDQAQETLDIYSRMASDDTAQVISSSYGFREDDWIPGNEQFAIDEGQIFEQLAAQGQTVCIAAGDQGAYDDENNTTPNVGLEAAMPYVLSVGGTDLTDGPGETYISETSWGDPNDTSRGPMGTGGGGGISSYWPIPDYQVGAFNPSVNTQGSLSYRNLPDVSLFADGDDNGYEAMWTDLYGIIGPAGTQYTFALGGTSAAAPLWGGLLTAVNAGRASAGEPGLGFADPAIYALAEEPVAYKNDFHDINDGSNNLFYDAVAGYDNATGWGSFQANNLYSDLLAYGLPLVPTGLVATPEYESVSLTWNTDQWATSYNIYRGTAAGGEGSTPLASVTGTAYDNAGITDGVTYYYVITAAGSAGRSSRSAEVSATPTSLLPPSAPAWLAATAGMGTVNLSWAASSSATSYNVYRGTASGGESSEAIGSAAGTTYFDSGLAVETTYFYKVAAVSSAGTSPMSSEASATSTDPPYPVYALTATAGSTQVALSWSGGFTATSFNIYRATASGAEGSTAIAASIGMPYTDTGLTNGVEYYYEVSAVNGAGTTPQSAEASATPEPAPTAPVNLTAVAGVDEISLTWTGSTGAVSYDIYQGTASVAEGATAVQTGVAGTSATLLALVPGISYYFTVTAVNAYGQSAPSNEAHAMAVFPTLVVLHTFTGPDGLFPVAGLTTGGNGNFYGTTMEGGLNYTPTGDPGEGVVYDVTPSGEMTAIYSFSGSDGSWPAANLVRGSDGNLYGSTEFGGTGYTTGNTSSGYGTIFKVTPGGALTTLYSFSGPDGSLPAVALVQGSDGNYYGTTEFGGIGYMMEDSISGDGTVFKITPTGALTALYYFSGPDGAEPEGALVQGSDGNFYGTTAWGGSAGLGTVFRITPQGQFTTLHSFVGSDGAFPQGGLVLGRDGSFYGSTYGYPVLPEPWSPDCGTVFKITTAGEFSTVYAFTGMDGLNPQGSLIQGSDGNIYGSTTMGGASMGSGPVNDGYGTLFRVSTGGVLNTLHSFNGSDGVFPESGVIQGSDGNLYGTAPTTILGVYGGSVYVLVLSQSPANLTATAGNQQVSLSWTPAAGASSYNIYRGTAAGGESAAPIETSETNTSFTDIGLVNGTSYYYQVAAVGALGTSSMSNEACAAPGPSTPPAVPAGLTATPGIEQVALGWRMSSGATSYNVYRGTAAGGESATPAASGVPAASFTDTGLSLSTTYYYKVAAVNGYGTSPMSTEVWATPQPPPAPAAPTILSATASIAQVSLNWTASTYATSYNVYRGTARGLESATPDASGLAATSFVDTGLTNGATYYYTVAAVNTYGTSPMSNEESATPEQAIPAAPTELRATPGIEQVTLVWNPSIGATSYDVYSGTSAGGESTTPITTGVTSASYTDTGLYLTPYYYKVAAVDSSGTSALSTEAAATPEPPIPPTPTGLVATAGNALVVLSWNGASVWNNSVVDVYRSTVSGDEGSNPIALTTLYVTSYTDTGLTNGVTYYYTVSASNAGGTSAQSSEESATPVLPIPPTPTGLAATAGNAQVSLSWNATSLSNTIDIYRSTASGAEGSTPVCSIPSTNTSYTNVGLTNGVKYYFTIAQSNASGTSAQSNEASTTLAPNAPTGLTATAGNAQVGLSWTSSYAATSYAIYRATTSGVEGVTPVAAAAGLSYTNSGLTNGVMYYFKVAAVNAGGTSAQSSEVSATPEPPAPVTPAGLTATAGNAQVALSWTASAGATSYSVYRGTASGAEPATSIGTATTTSFTDTGVTNFVTYYYKVAAVDGGGTSAQSNETSATPTPPLSPTHVLWSNGNGSLSLWNDNPATGTYTQNTYGPFANWTPAAIADGPDGMTRVLWVSTIGAAAVWSVNGSTGGYTQYGFGPYPGWTASAVTVSPSNVTHVLWCSSGSASIWNYNTGTGGYTQSTFGTYPGWSAKTIADGQDGLTRLLWVSSSGTASIWSVNATTGAFTQNSFGPYPSWSAVALSVNAANTTHVLWTNVSKVAALWNYNTSTGAFTQNDYGVFPGWTATSITDGPDHNTQLLWDSTSGSSSIWDLNNTTGTYTQNTFGPFGGWTATALSAYP